jgi:hypothetical protein
MSIVIGLIFAQVLLVDGNGLLHNQGMYKKTRRVYLTNLTRAASIAIGLAYFEMWGDSCRSSQNKDRACVSPLLDWFGGCCQGASSHLSGADCCRIRFSMPRGGSHRHSHHRHREETASCRRPQ